MSELLILLRTKQLFAHNLHNTVSRIVFLQDHEFLGDIYSKAEGHYDSVAERMIGLGQAPNLVQVQEQAVATLKQLPENFKDNTEALATLCDLNKHILAKIEVVCKMPGISQGTLQLVGGIADEIEVECYKLGQRVKK